MEDEEVAESWEEAADSGVSWTQQGCFASKSVWFLLNGQAEN